MFAIQDKKQSKHVKGHSYLCTGFFPHWTNGGFTKFDTKLKAKQEAMKIGLISSQYKIVKIV